MADIRINLGEWDDCVAGYYKKKVNDAIHSANLSIDRALSSLDNGVLNNAVSLASKYGVSCYTVKEK